jgi:outer membrane murein-binding lipoprotein Lpp
MSKAKRTPGDVLRESRQKDSQAKRAKVLAVLDTMKASGETITFLGVARAAEVSNWLVYAEGVREHIEAAMKGQGKAERRTRQAGANASAASLATDLALVREENKALREERDTLKKAVQRSLGAQLDQAGTKELTARVNELLAAVERLSLERDEIRGERDALKRKLAEAEDDLTAAREAGRRMLRQVNRPS